MVLRENRGNYKVLLMLHKFRNHSMKAKIFYDENVTAASILLRHQKRLLILSNHFYYIIIWFFDKKRHVISNCWIIKKSIKIAEPSHTYLPPPLPITETPIVINPPEEEVYLPPSNDEIPPPSYLPPEYVSNLCCNGYSPPSHTHIEMMIILFFFFFFLIFRCQIINICRRHHKLTNRLIAAIHNH